MEVIAATVHYYYAAPQDAGVPWEDGEWAVPTMDIVEVLGELHFDAHSGFFDDVLEGFHSSFWVESADGFWTATRANDRLPLAWKAFVETVKHRTRFHFLAQAESIAKAQDYLTPDEVLSSVAELLQKFNFLQEVPAGTHIYRARLRAPHDTWPLDEDQLGAPPSEFASAGRMNPAGISYFYGAFKPGTAIAEVVSRPPTEVALGKFETTKPLLMVDLTKTVQAPSVFDPDRRDERAKIFFLREFTRQISQPVQKNGREHIEYVPSQVVCEYLAQVFELAGDGRSLAGIVFPSTVQPGDNNIVLFPTDRSWKYRFEGLRFIAGKKFKLNNWSNLIKSLSIAPPFAMLTSRAEAG